MFNSFNSDNNYFIHQLTNCNLTDFELFFSSETPKEISKKDYLNICSNLIQQLKNKDYQKVVLSRVKKTKINKNPIDIFNQLNQKYTNTFNYIISIENVGCWIGATPELLAEFDKNQFKTVSLAGTKQHESIEWTNKEKEEQQFVTDYIFNQLKKSIKQIEKTAIETIKAGEVYHLKTNFNGKIVNESDWINIIDTLHPTPATCGLPKKESQSLINQIEPHERKFYTGFLGIVSPNHKLLMVNLRCMQIINNNAFLYLGGGITAKSKAENEWTETVNKSKTLLNVVQ